MVGTLNGKADQIHHGGCTLAIYIVVTLPDAIQTISHEGIGAFRYSQSLLMIVSLMASFTTKQNLLFHHWS